MTLRLIGVGFNPNWGNFFGLIYFALLHVSLCWQCGKCDASKIWQKKPNYEKTELSAT